MTELLEASRLVVDYGAGRDSFRAVDGVSFTIRDGETVGLVGESGCGKSSLARAVLRLQRASGQLHFAGQDWLALPAAELRRARRQLQAVFQDPLASLNPRFTVRDCLLEPVRVHQPGLPAGASEQLLHEMISRVGLDADYLDRFPHQLSGGQCQRVAIGRALIGKPDLVILDEPVSALDMSIRGQVLGLLATLQRDLGTAYLFIAHDMSAVRYLCQRVLVMFAGEIVEAGSREDIFERPSHPYTRALLHAVLPPNREDQPPADPMAEDVTNPPREGCRFAPRCRFATERCRRERPGLAALAEPSDHAAACHHADSLPAWQE